MVDGGDNCMVYTQHLKEQSDDATAANGHGIALRRT